MAASMSASPANSARGFEQIIEINLTTEERIALQKSAASVQELVNVLGL